MNSRSAGPRSWRPQIEAWAIHPALLKNLGTRRQARLIFWCCVVAGPALLLAIILEGLYSQDYQRAVVVGVGHTLTCCMVVSLRFSRTLHRPAMLLTVLATTQLLSATWWTGGLSSPVIGVYPLATIFLALIGTIWMSLTSTIILIFGLLFAFILQVNGLLPDASEPLIPMRIAIAAWTVLTGLAVAVFNQRHNTIHLQRISEELERRTQAQTEAERLRDQWEGFLTYVSHELRNPLTTISGSLELIEMTSDEQRRDRYLRSMGLASRRLVSLADDVLDYTTLERGKLQLRLQTIDLTLIAQHSLDEWSSQTQPSQQIRLISPGSMMATVDPNRVGQILGNLISNAIKYGNGTDIDLTLSIMEEKIAVITVSDSGPGIPAALRGVLFEAFSRAEHTDRKGTGLGLSIALHLARAMHGDLKWLDTPQPGARFQLLLPLAAGLAQADSSLRRS